MYNDATKAKMNLTHIKWNKTSTGGNLIKTAVTKRYFLKLSSYSDFEGIIGHECVNEIIVDRLVHKAYRTKMNGKNMRNPG